jgi:hypothetical protein
MNQYANREELKCSEERPQSEAILSQIELIRTRLDGLINASERAKARLYGNTPEKESADLSGKQLAPNGFIQVAADQLRIVNERIDHLDKNLSIINQF